MIVTRDANSSYELAPTLRLFLQPMDLLPPPPAHVDGGDDLPAEYVDPIAGLTKLGRDGRTLYIRPVEELEEERDISREESDDGLFEMRRSQGPNDNPGGALNGNGTGNVAGERSRRRPMTEKRPENIQRCTVSGFIRRGARRSGDSTSKWSYEISNNVLPIGSIADLPMDSGCLLEIKL